MTQPLLQAGDLRGAARLTTGAVAGLTSLVEAMHARIARLHLRGARAGDERTRGLTGLVYRPRLQERARRHPGGGRQCRGAARLAWPCAAPARSATASARAARSSHRCAGIRDLQFGNIVGGPAGADGLHQSPPVRLPDATRCYAIAANLGPAEGKLAGKLLGDGLVSVDSALGRHHETARRLAVADAGRAVVHETGHLDLLSSAEVSNLLRQWLHAAGTP